MKAAFDAAYDNIAAFHTAQRQADLSVETMPGVHCRRVTRPIGALTHGDRRARRTAASDCARAEGCMHPYTASTRSARARATPQHRVVTRRL